MSDMPTRCVTHHNACDCREWRINEVIKTLTADLAAARSWGEKREAAYQRLRQQRDAFRDERDAARAVLGEVQESLLPGRRWVFVGALTRIAIGRVLGVAPIELPDANVDHDAWAELRERAEQAEHDLAAARRDCERLRAGINEAIMATCFMSDPYSREISVKLEALLAAQQPASDPQHESGATNTPEANQ